MNKKQELRFNEEGRFRVLLLSDAHHAPDTGNRTIEAMELLIDHSRPDFVLLLGDNIAGHSTEEQCRLLMDQLASEITMSRCLASGPWIPSRTCRISQTSLIMMETCIGIF